MEEIANVDSDKEDLAKFLAERDANLTPEELAQRKLQDEIDWHEPGDDKDD